MAFRIQQQTSNESIKIVLKRKYLLDGSQEWAFKAIEATRNDSADADQGKPNDHDGDDGDDLETVKEEVNKAAIALINMKSSPGIVRQAFTAAMSRTNR